MVNWCNGDDSPTSSLDSTHPYEDQSPEITDQDDVATFAASCQRQLSAVMRPGKVKNLSRLKIRNLFRRSAARFLAPDVRDTVPGQHVLDCLTPWCPARLFAAQRRPVELV